MTQNQLPVHYTSAHPADDLSSVQITLAHFSAAGSVSPASALAFAPQPLRGLNHESVAYNAEPHIADGEARNSKLEKWLLASAVISVTTLFTVLYTIRHPEWVHSLVAQYGVTRNSELPDVLPAAQASLKHVDRSTAPHHVTNSGARRNLASGVDETVTLENSRPHTHSGNHTAMSNAGNLKSSGGMLPALSMQPKQGILVPPPPPTPCVLPPASGFFAMQPGQPYAAPQQESQQAQAQTSLKTRYQSADRENTPQLQTGASGRTEANQSAALADADQELQAAMNSSLHTVGEWTR